MLTNHNNSTEENQDNVEHVDSTQDASQLLGNSDLENKKDKLPGKVSPILKKLKNTLLYTLLLGTTAYVGGGKIANSKMQDRQFEQGVMKVKDQNNKYQYTVGGINLDSVIQENQLNISPEKLYAIFANEQENKTKTLVGSFVSDMSEGLRKIHPVIPTPNHSYGTWQLQDMAFIDFMKSMSIKEKNDFVTKLGTFTINGKTILESCGYSENQRGDFMNYVMRWEYETEDGDDNLWGRGNGKLGFAMSILMIEEIHNSTVLNQNNLIETQFGNNLAAPALITDNYANGLANAYWSTNYVRASVDAPEQLDQNIKIIGMFMDGIISIDDISIPKWKKNTGKFKLYMPDGDKGKIFVSNQHFIEEKKYSYSNDYILYSVKSRFQTLSLKKKKELAKLLLASSFETFYFGILDINEHATFKNIDLIDNIINNKSITDNDLEEYLDNISKLEKPMLDRLIAYCLDALTISSHQDIRRTVPVIQSHYHELQNEVNTLARFSKGGGGIQTESVKNTRQGDTVKVDTILSEPVKQDTIKTKPIDVNPNTTKTDAKVDEKNNKEVHKKGESNNEGKKDKVYKKVGSVVIKKGTQGRDIVWDNQSVKRRIIQLKMKDIDGKIITATTDKKRLPLTLIAKCLSTDGITPMSVAKLNKLYIGEKIYIILPTEGK